MRSTTGSSPRPRPTASPRRSRHERGMTERLDTLGIWDVTFALPEQVDAAITAADGLEGLPDHDDIENVVVLGMGGSGIAGDLMTAVAGPFMATPIVVTKGY